MKNILVFPCGSEIGLDIYNCLKYSTYFNLIGASSIDDHGRFVYENYIGNVPLITDSEIVPFFKEIVREYKIDAIYPTMDSVLYRLKIRESDLGCKVISSSAEVTELCLYKSRTYQRLKNIVAVPVVYQREDPIEFPVFVKPNVGYGAIGAKLIKNQEELNSELDNNSDILILENLPGEEYTVDCFTSRDGVLKFAAARQRNRIKSGMSVNTSYVEDQADFLHMAYKINAEIGFRGAWFFQVKRRANGELCLLEIASRFGGSSLLSKAIGVNLPLLTLFDAFGYDVELVQNNYGVELDRAMGCRYKMDLIYDTVYVDYDDCLVLNKSKVNTELVAFLYACRNKNVKVILLTKHAGNLEESLRQFRLSEVFDEILHLKQENDKWRYIKEKNAIFVDDSHSERKDVQRALNIPVFSPEMIDILL